AFSVVCTVGINPGVILKHLLSMLNSSSFEQSAMFSEQFFLVVVETIECLNDQTLLSELGSQVLKQLMSIRSIETYQSQFVDQRLLGLIRVLHVLVRKKVVDTTQLPQF